MTIERRIRSDIEARIHSGDWRPGYRIPFEHELVTAYGCSRATVSKALEGLARTGLIERRRKAGSFVAHPHIQSAVLEVADLAALITSKGEVYKWSCTSRRIAEGVDFTDVSNFAAPALRIEGVHFSNGEPFAIEMRMISLATVPHAATERFECTAPGTWLLEHVPWTKARHTIRAIEADQKSAQSLGIRVGSACLKIERWTWRSDQPVTYVNQLFPGDRYDLVAEFQPDSRTQP